MFFLHHADEPLLGASRAEQSQAIETLIGAMTLRRGYYLLLTLSVLIITPGLLLGNTAVIIGGMLLAPLLAPILTLSLSLIARSVVGIIHSLKVLAFSLLLVIVLSYGLTAVLQYAGRPVTWIPQTIPLGPYLLIAFCSGIAAAFAWVKKDLSPAISGVAIAVSLLPPLCAVGIGLATGQIVLAERSIILFLGNVGGILLAAMLVFIALGFLPMKKVEEKAIAQADESQ